MGEVYRARDTRLDREVAIKVLPSHLSEKPESRARFEREAKTISGLQHPNICVLYDVGCQDGVDFLVMEYLEGETLADHLRKGPLSLDQVLKVGTEICKGLEKAHRSGVVHRDLKPGNIMLTKSGAKLMDFGLAKAPGAAVGSLSSSNSLATMSKALTTEGTIVGTIQYMCPEQLEGREADARSDIFSLGAVLYEMTTGKRAFDGKTTASTIAAILAVEPTPISTIQPMLPHALDHIVTACLAKDPDERFQTAHDVDLQLGWVAEGKSQLGTPAGALQSGRNRVWITVGVAVLALCAGFALAHLNRTVEVPSVIRSSIVPPEKTSFADSPSEWAPPMATTLASFRSRRRRSRMMWLRRSVCSPCRMDRASLSPTAMGIRDYGSRHGSISCRIGLRGSAHARRRGKRRRRREALPERPRQIGRHKENAGRLHLYRPGPIS
jgi:serine/threonine protein kinase